MRISAAVSSFAYGCVAVWFATKGDDFRFYYWFAASLFFQGVWMILAHMDLKR